MITARKTNIPAIISLQGKDEWFVKDYPVVPVQPWDRHLTDRGALPQAPALEISEQDNKPSLRRSFLRTDRRLPIQTGFFMIDKTQAA